MLVYQRKCFACWRQIVRLPEHRRFWTSPRRWDYDKLLGKDSSTYVLIHDKNHPPQATLPKHVPTEISMAKCDTKAEQWLMPISIDSKQLPTSLWLKSLSEFAHVFSYHLQVVYCFTLDSSTNSPFTRPKRWSWSPLAVMADPSWWTWPWPDRWYKTWCPKWIEIVFTDQSLAKLNNTANSIAFQRCKEVPHCISMLSSSRLWFKYCTSRPTLLR